MQVERCGYFIPVNQVKSNGEKLSQEDLINIGYMAGRCGINLDGNVLVGMEIATPGVDVLVVTERGYGKKTPIDEYRITSRGGKGVKTLNITEKESGTDVGTLLKKQSEKAASGLICTPQRRITEKVRKQM